MRQAKPARKQWNEQFSQDDVQHCSFRQYMTSQKYRKLKVKITRNK